jgi:hypothetical protein
LAWILRPFSNPINPFSVVFWSKKAVSEPQFV